MEQISLIVLVFVLGLRHGVDADHLACIDGLTRFNWRSNRSISKWVGTLFSFGHGCVVAGIAILIGMFSKEFELPQMFDTVATWISIGSLALIGTVNTYNLLHTSGVNYQVKGIKGKWIPKFLKETTNPFLIILIGALFAIAADTVSQTSVWALSAGHSNPYMPFILGMTFLAGMMLTDTFDSWMTYRMLAHSHGLGQRASRWLGWVIATLAYGVALYEATTFFFPSIEVDFEIVGIVIFSLMLLALIYVSRKNSSQRLYTEKSM